MMSPDHICARPICPAGRSLYIVMVTFGEVAVTSALSCSPTIFRSASDEVLTSVMPCCRSTIAIAVCKSSMTAVLPLYCGSHSDVVRILQRADVGGHLVVPPADSGGVDGVRHGVAPLLVVPGVGEGRPHVLDVRDVGVVQRSDQVAHSPAG